MLVTSVNINQLPHSAGATFGPSKWRVVSQGMIDAFAEVTDDRQWIHTDPARAASSLFGGTVAHGLLTLSLIPAMIEEVLEVTGRSMGINYGYNKVRFPAAVPSGGRIRAEGEIARAARREIAVESELVVTVEVEGQTKPACVARMVAWHMP